MTHLVRACLVASLLVAASACEDNVGPEPAPDDAGTVDPGTQPDGGEGDGGGTAQTALLRVVHASPDAPPVDVYAAGSAAPLVTNLAYSQTSAFASVPAGTYTLEVRAAGADAASPPVYTVGPVTLTDGSRTTAVAAGLLASANGDAFRVLPLKHGFGAATAGTVRARIVHAGADAPTVDVDVGDDGTPELPNVDRFAESGAEGVSLPAGLALQVGIRAQGARVTAFTTPALPDGAELFLVATGLLEAKARADDGFAILAVGPNGTLGLIRQNPLVYALHASPDAPEVDLFIGADELADNLGFGGLSAPTQIAPGTYTVDFFAHEAGPSRPTTMPVGSEVTSALEAGERYLVIATGFVTPMGDEQELQLVALPEAFDGAGGQARVRVVHASPDAPAVDVGVVNGAMFTPLMGLGNLEFASASSPDGMQASPGPLVLGVAPAGTTTPAATFEVMFSAGQEGFIVAAGALTPASGEKAFQLIAVDTAQTPWSAAAVSPMSP